MSDQKCKKEWILGFLKKLGAISERDGSDFRIIAQIETVISDIKKLGAISEREGFCLR